MSSQLPPGQRPPELGQSDWRGLCPLLCDLRPAHQLQKLPREIPPALRGWGAERGGGNDSRVEGVGHGAGLEVWLARAPTRLENVDTGPVVWWATLLSLSPRFVSIFPHLCLWMSGAERA